MERHHKKLKSRLNKFNFSSDKKYELDDEDCYDDFNYKSILQDENKQNNEKHLSNINELINIKTDYFTNNSQLNIKENYTTQNDNIEENDENSSDPAKMISDKHNKFMLYKDEQEKNLNFESDFYFDGKNNNNINNNLNNVGNKIVIQEENFNNENGIVNNNFNSSKIVNKLFNAKNKLENINISSINPMPTMNNANHKKRSTKGNKAFANQKDLQGNNFLMRNDSFSLPRTNSRMFTNLKNKK